MESQSYQHDNGLTITIDDKPSFGADGFWIRAYVTCTYELNDGQTKRFPLSIGVLKVERFRLNDPRVEFEMTEHTTDSRVLPTLYREAIRHAHERYPEHEVLVLNSWWSPGDRPKAHLAMLPTFEVRQAGWREEWIVQLNQEGAVT